MEQFAEVVSKGGADTLLSNVGAGVVAAISQRVIGGQVIPNLAWWIAQGPLASLGI